MLLRVGLAFVFLYASVSCLLDPASFMIYMPSSLPVAWTRDVCLPAFSAYEAVLALWLLSGRRLFVVSLLAAATVGGIVVINLDMFSLLFRNVAITFAALSLAVQAREAEVPRPAGAESAGQMPSSSTASADAGNIPHIVTDPALDAVRSLLVGSAPTAEGKPG